MDGSGISSQFNYSGGINGGDPGMGNSYMNEALEYDINLTL
jgi:hypothetical protein